MGDAEAKPAQLLGEVLVPEHAGRAQRAAPAAFDHRVQVDRRPRDLAG